MIPEKSGQTKSLGIENLEKISSGLDINVR